MGKRKFPGIGIFVLIIILVISPYSLHADGSGPFVSQEAPQQRTVPVQDAQIPQVQVAPGDELSIPQKERVLGLLTNLEENAARDQSLFNETNQQISERIFGSIVQESGFSKPGGDDRIDNAASNADGGMTGTGPLPADGKLTTAETKSFDGERGLGKDTVVSEDARKNERIQQLFFEPNFMRGLWTAPGDATSNMFPRTGQLLASPMLEEGAKRVSQFVRDRYATVRDKLGKENIDDQLRERIRLVELLKEKINEEALVQPVGYKDGKYMVIDGVDVSKELAAVYYLMHPPQQLHPYLRYLLYTRLVDPQVMRWYLAITEKMNAIYKQAKAGKGKIRYKGKIISAFRPMPYDMGGAYELVTEFSKPEKAHLDNEAFSEK